MCGKPSTSWTVPTFLFEGKVIKHGTSEEIANDPIARKQYLGDQFRM